MYIDLDNTTKTPVEIYHLGVTLVTPRPIGFISTRSPDGVRNLAPFSFFNMVSANPPVLMFCPARKRDAGKKDTLVNVEATGEFVAAVVTSAMVEKMHQTSAMYPPEVDEFTAVGFTPRPATKVRAALVAESPANCECLVERIIDWGERPTAGAVVFGRIVALHVDDAYLALDGLLDPEKVQAVGRMGRTSYTLTDHRFDLPPARV